MTQRWRFTSLSTLRFLVKQTLHIAATLLLTPSHVMATLLSSACERKRKERRSRMSDHSSDLPLTGTPRPKVAPSDCHTPRTPSDEVAAGEVMATASMGLFARHMEEHVIAMDNVSSARKAYNDALKVRLHTK